MPESARSLMLALLASPRPRGANARLLTAFLRGVRGPAWRIRRVALAGLRIQPYSGQPRRRLQTARRDPMENLIALFDQADALVLASPVYFYGFPAQAKAMIDRCQPLWQDPFWRKRPRRPAYFLSTCAFSRRSEFAIIVRQAKAFLHTIGFFYAGELLVPGRDRTDSGTRLRRAVLHAERLGRRFKEQVPAPGGFHG
jgi:multimeric flavodoxin WrbA